MVHILSGKMSIVGPRPALWNQYDLIDERDKYGANGIRPGLTGWAQVNGRDELPIKVKAGFDGEYVQKMGFVMDCRCFLMTIFKVLRSEGVVEGKAVDGAESASVSVRRHEGASIEGKDIAISIENGESERTPRLRRRRFVRDE